MLKNRLLFAVLLGLSLSGALFQKTAAQQRVMADKVVAVVGNSMVLYSDMVQVAQAFADQRRQEGYTSDKDPMCEALEYLVTQKILSSQARADSLSIMWDRIATAVEDALINEIDDKGSQAEVEKYYHKPIYEIRTDLTARYEDQQYASAMENEVKGKVTITSGEVERYFRKLPKDSLPLIPEQYVYSQIVLYPPSIEDAKLRTRTRLLEMRERIMNGQKFETLARMYSEDPGSARQGGEMEPMPKEGFVQPFADAMAKLKVGQISEVVETEYGYHLIQLMEVTGRNLYRVRHILLKPQFTADELSASFKLCDSLRAEIRAGRMTYEQAVFQYSEDRYSKNNDGVVSNLDVLEAMNQAEAKAASTHFLKEELAQFPEVYNGLKNLKPGEISEPFASQDLKGNVLCRMVRLNEIVPAHTATLGADFARVEEIVLRKKQDDVYKAWLDKTIDGMFIRINPEYHSCEFENKSLIK